jgi:hypothetical protein
MNMKLNEKQLLIAELRAKFGSTMTRKDLVAFVESNKGEWPNWLVNTKALRGSVRGTYNLIAAEKAFSNVSTVDPVTPEVEALEQAEKSA